MVGDLGSAIGEVEDLARLDAGDLGVAQIAATAPALRRRVVDDPVGLRDALEVSAGSAGLLSLVALALLALRRLAPGLTLLLVSGEGGRDFAVVAVFGQFSGAVMTDW